MTVPLSVYFRTQNEARNIGRSIAAVRSLSDDIIVVDGGSTDATVDIARAAGAQVISQPWLGNGHQKRVGEARCRHHFVLDLDADEVITADLRDEIAALWASGGPKFAVYRVPLVMVSPVTGLPASYTTDRRCKLYDKRVVRAPAHAVWDQFDVPASVRVGTLKGVLVHYSFRDLADLTAKLNRVSTRRVETIRHRSRANLAARVLFGMPFYFANHLLRRGFVRGAVYGIALARVNAHARWLRDAKAYELLLMDRDEAVRSRQLIDP